MVVGEQIRCDLRKTKDRKDKIFFVESGALTMRRYRRYTLTYTLSRHAVIVAYRFA